jgi:hypothetical protein
MRINQELQLEMLGHVNDWQHSGLSQIAYSQEQGISFSKFNYWVRKSRPSAAPVQGFVSIKLDKNPASISAHPVMELVSPGGSRLTFYSHVDPEFIKRLL